MPAADSRISQSLKSTRSNFCRCYRTGEIRCNDTKAFSTKFVDDSGIVVVVSGSSVHCQNGRNGCCCLWVCVQELHFHVDAGRRTLAEDERFVVPHCRVRLAACPYADVPLVTRQTKLMTGGRPDEE